MIGEKQEVISGKGNDPELVGARNVAGELEGVLAAMGKAKEAGVKKLTVFYDYFGIERFALREGEPGYYRAQKPTSVWYQERVRKIMEDMEITFVHVDAHTGIPGNELADELAKKAVDLR